jgi:DNA-binding transcriptional MerR regulator
MTPEALRYYERVGLIAPVPRTPAGYRAYPPDFVERIRFIKQAQRQGLTLAEIRELVRLDAQHDANQCRRVQRLLERKLADLDARLVELQQFRRQLAIYLTQCNRSLDERSDAPCPVVEGMRRSAQ